MRKFLRPLISLGMGIVTLASPVRAGHSVGNGGDAVKCKGRSGQGFAGYYSLDYLLTYRATNANADIVGVADLDASFTRIRKLLARAMPELVPSFDEFRASLFKDDDHGRRRWQEAPFGLEQLNDQEIVSSVPAECRDGEKISLVQAAIRQRDIESGMEPGKILYHWVPSVLKELPPLQQSFLLVHEWLWDFSNDVALNRRLNRFFHSRHFADLSPEEVKAEARTLGFVFSAGCSTGFWNPAVQLSVDDLKTLVAAGAMVNFYSGNPKVTVDDLIAIMAAAPQRPNVNFCIDNDRYSAAEIRRLLAGGANIAIYPSAPFTAAEMSGFPAAIPKGAYNYVQLAVTNATRYTLDEIVAMKKAGVILTVYR